MSANRRTPAPPADELRRLKQKNQALRKRIKDLESERDEYIHAANALSIKLVTVDQIKEWENEEESGGDLRDLIKKWEKDMKPRKR